MKLRPLPFVALACLLALAACAQKNPHPMDMSQAVQTATSKADHLALAQHYEEAAAAAQAQVKEHQKTMVQYEEKPYLYGKDIYNVEEHCAALINLYQQAADANLKLAAMHRKLAAAAP